MDPYSDFPFLPIQIFKYLLGHECRAAERYMYYFGLVCIIPDRIESKTNLIQDLFHTMKGVIRDSDVPGLLLDNNFGLILHGTDGREVRTVIRRIQKKFQQYPNPVHSKRKIRMGWACFPTHAITPQELIKATRKRGVHLWI